jgi:hypothetical protein
MDTLSWMVKTGVVNVTFRRRAASEIYAAPILFPIAVAGGFQPSATTDLARNLGLVRIFLYGLRFDGLRLLGSWLRLAYHGGRFVQTHKG